MKSETIDTFKPLDLNDVIGNFGKWQFFILFVALVSQLIGTGHILGTVYIAPDVDYWCKKASTSVEFGIVEGPGETSGYLASNLSSTLMPMDGVDNEEELALIKPRHQCKKRGKTMDSDMFISDNVNITAPPPSNCTEWEFDHSVFVSTITEEFGLVCDKSWYISLSRTILMAGFMTACLLFGLLADWFGRKPVILCSNLIFLVSTFICTYSGNFLVFSCAQFFVGFGKTGFTNALYILLMESTGTKWRSIIAMVDGFGYCFGFLILPGLAYWLRSWRQLQLAYSVPVALLFVLSLFLPESPRWLLSTGSSKAEKVLKEAMKINGKPKKQGFEETNNNLAVIMKQATSGGARKDKYSIYHLLITPNMRKKSLVLFFTWTVVLFVYYGLSLNANDGLGRGHHPFVTMAIFGAVLFPSRILVHFAITYIGRRKSLMISLFGVGVSCIVVTPFTPASNGSSLVWAKIVFATIGMCFVSSAMSIMYVYTSELFPTKIRSVGFTSCSFFARVGSMISPFMKELGEGNDFMVPMGVFGFLAILNAFLVLILPETKGSYLPETLKEGEEFGKKSKEHKETTTKNSVFYTAFGDNILEETVTRF